MNQFLITAAAEKLSALHTVDYLRQRAERADLKEFERILDLVPNGTKLSSCAPTGQNTTAQGNALGTSILKNRSPEGAAQHEHPKTLLS